MESLNKSLKFEAFKSKTSAHSWKLSPNCESCLSSTQTGTPQLLHFRAKFFELNSLDSNRFNSFDVSKVCDSPPLDCYASELVGCS